MSDARAGGHLPILVPRDPALGEHVDGHQMRFAGWVESKGLATVARDADTFASAVAAAPTVARRPQPTHAWSRPPRGSVSSSGPR